MTAWSHTLARGQWSTLRRNAPLLLVYGLIVVLMVIGTVSSERFFTERNLFNVLRSAAFLGTVAIGQTLVILTAGIDLSVGSVVKLSVLVSAIWMDGNPDNLVTAIIGTLLLGAFIGVIHALTVTRLNIAPFIVTLGTFSILRGVSLLIASGPVGRATPEFLGFYDQKIGPVPVIVILFALLIVVLVLMLRRTRFGRYIYAVGGSEEVARLSGIHVNRVKFGVYVLCSTLAAATGLLWLTRMGVGDPVIGDGLELQAITAVIIGGTSLFGGRGGVLGTIGGVLLLVLTQNLLVVLSVNRFIQELIQGLIIVAAVALYKQNSSR
jgi:ribose/xylose/arabinose/galactoside ABC-type transport system permease subunit